MNKEISASLRNYLEGAFPKIAGWCNPYMFQAVQAVSEFQRTIGLNAPVAEIGVFQGKFLLLLASSVQSPGPHHAFDVFDLQDFNLDHAGAGNLQNLTKNIQLAGKSLENFEIVKRDSTTFRQGQLQEIRNRIGGFSLFSVDGCHLPEHTVNDIRVAMELTSDAGVIFVDDYYNPSWPGVQEGVSKLYFSDYPVYVPFAYTSNKLMLCHIGYHKKYLDFTKSFFEKNFPGTKIKNVVRFGYENLTLLPDAGSKPLIA